MDPYLTIFTFHFGWRWKVSLHNNISQQKDWIRMICFAIIFSVRHLSPGPSHHIRSSFIIALFSFLAVFVSFIFQCSLYFLLLLFSQRASLLSSLPSRTLHHHLSLYWFFACCFYLFWISVFFVFFFLVYSQLATVRHRPQGTITPQYFITPENSVKK